MYVCVYVNIVAQNHKLHIFRSLISSAGRAWLGGLGSPLRHSDPRGLPLHGSLTCVATERCQLLAGGFGP